MSRYRWCSFCTHSFHEGELAEDEYGLPVCPYCGAPGMYLRAWNAVRSLFPDLPVEPVAGERYRLAESDWAEKREAGTPAHVPPRDDDPGHVATV